MSSEMAKRWAVRKVEEAARGLNTPPLGNQYILLPGHWVSQGPLGTKRETG